MLRRRFGEGARRMEEQIGYFSGLEDGGETTAEWDGWE
jgi:hypothetical protein